MEKELEKEYASFTAKDQTGKIVPCFIRKNAITMVTLDSYGGVIICRGESMSGMQVTETIEEAIEIICS